uniref:probable G-protein coupled receptor 82 n=1 Tax=Semicossyphus pulcher TaxID=241346 RepID=UPI0037E74334
MELALNTSPPDNSSSSSSSSSSVLSLCPTATTLLFLPSAYTLLFLIALPGNVLSLWVFWRSIPSISSTHVYLSHLSVSNLMLTLTAPFLSAYYAWGSLWRLSGVLCQLVLHAITPLLHINIYISLVILTLVALSRFASLIQHTHASHPSACTTLLPNGFFSCLTRTAFASRVCVAVWVVAVGGIVPVTVYYSVKEAAAGGDGGAERGGGGGAGVCYSPAVELGGSLSAAFTVPLIILFFVFYLLVLLCYMIVLGHIRRSRRCTKVPTSHRLLGRVLRNIVVIQAVLSVCLLPYHIFKPIFISLVHHQHLPTYSPEHNLCHPLSNTIELKNCLMLLTALRAATDPLMYFLLDKTFRHQTNRLIRCKPTDAGSRQTCWSATGSATQNAGQQGGGNVAAVTVDSSHDDVLESANLKKPDV